MTISDQTRTQLRRHEGVRPEPYQDTEGKWTIGIGHCLEAKPLKPAFINALFESDLHDAENDARALVGDACYNALSEARQAVLINMAFNLGLTKLRKFTKCLAAIKDQRYTDAAAEMLASKWAAQTQGRAIELAKQMDRGEWAS